MPLNDLLENRRRRSPLLVPLTVLALFVLIGGAFLLGRASVGTTDEPTLPPIASDDEGDGSGEGGDGGELLALDEEEAPPPAPHLPGDLLPGTSDLRGLHAEIRGSLSSTLASLIGQEIGDPLSLVTSRLLVWWLDVSRDLRVGDTLDLVYELPEGSEPVVHALRYRSSKLARTFEAWRFQIPGAPYARYYDERGAEVELRLVDGPIAEYEQITSLLKDGRRHKGVDFKAPVGTQVVAPWAGVVRRKNWNYRINGGSLEIEDSRGRKILFLHLSEIPKELGPGSRVSKGQAIALSGNTGRSTAPHLHYQVMSSAGRVLDPFDLHKTFRSSIPAEHLGMFRESTATLGGLFEVAAPGEVAELEAAD